MNSVLGRAETPPSQLLGIQYLRGIAALMVAFYHLPGQLPAYTSTFQRWMNGSWNLNCGVDIFFAISGFIMVISNRRSSPGRFLIKRLIRVVPLYWVLTTLLVLMTFVVPYALRTTIFSVDAYVKSLLFIPFSNTGDPGEVFPLLVPGWSLNYEMFFYLLFAGTLFLPSRFRLATMGITLGLLVAAGALPGHKALPPEILFYLNVRILEFWLGMGIAQLYLKRSLPRASFPASMLTIVTGAAVLLGAQNFLNADGKGISLFIGTVLPAAAIVLGTVLLEQGGYLRRHKFLQWLGDTSYSIYLSHVFSFGLARLLWGRMGLDDPTLLHVSAFTLFAMGMVIVGAWITYRAIEQPSLAMLQHLLVYRNWFPLRNSAALRTRD